MSGVDPERAARPTIPIANRREHLERARGLLATDRAEDLRYAALELRLSLEAMTYDKLRSFEKYLPKSFVERTWQPPQLLKAMKQLDENADQSVSLHIGPPYVEGITPRDDEYQLVGHHVAFSLKWLNKQYNKLGSFLHLQASRITDQGGQRRDLGAIADEIEKAQKGSLLGLWSGEAINFTCELCGEVSAVSAYYARTEGAASCLNPACELEYRAHSEGDEISLSPLLLRLKCNGCSAHVPVQQRHLRDGLVVACPTCKREHLIRCRWEYGILGPARAQAEASDGAKQ